MNAGCITTKSALPSFDEAMAIVAEETPLLGSESVSVLSAFGRITAASVPARLNSPPFDTSAMDGYAISFQDIELATRCFAIGSDIPAGMREPPPVMPGVVLPISTGARIPPGCDAVVRKELALIDDDKLRLHNLIKPGANIRREGEDSAIGDIVVPAGYRLTPASVGALVGCGIEAISVVRTPRIALFTTGDELGSLIPDANGPMIAAAIAELGLNAPQSAQLRDDRSEMITAIRALADAEPHDIIISTGGVSVGTHDHVVAVLRELGAKIHFHGVAMRPGKPTLFASFPNGTLYFGLPGNPVAALLGYRFFVVQAIRTMLGRAPELGRVVAPPITGRLGTTVFLKTCFDYNSGAVRVLEGQESHKVRPLVTADTWVKVENNTMTEATMYPLAGSI